MLIDQLLRGYNTRPRINNPLRNLHILVVNPLRLQFFLVEAEGAAPSLEYIGLAVHARR